MSFRIIYRKHHGCAQLPLFPLWECSSSPLGIRVKSRLPTELLVIIYTWMTSSLSASHHISQIFEFVWFCHLHIPSITMAKPNVSYYDYGMLSFKTILFSPTNIPDRPLSHDCGSSRSAFHSCLPRWGNSDCTIQIKCLVGYDCCSYIRGHWIYRTSSFRQGSRVTNNFHHFFHIDCASPRPDGCGMLCCFCMHPFPLHDVD